MWKYVQSTGLLTHDDETVAIGYSGKGEGKNDPLAQQRHNEGPLPQGRYVIQPPENTHSHGPYVLPLLPSSENEMFGRSGFLIHGDSKAAPGEASEGCIIMPRLIREQVWQSGDYDLEVVA